ncbi:MAG: aminotransferase class IV [Bacteroidia bacterium]
MCDYSQWQLAPGPLSGLKTLNALPYIMAGRYARQKGYDDAVIFSNGKVSETSRANLFVIKNKKVLTPPLSSCCLNGVMRKQIFKVCFQLKVQIKEQQLSSKDLLQADELFLTNSVRGMIPVGSYLSRNFQPGYGPISMLIQQSLEKLLLAEFV